MGEGAETNWGRAHPGGSSQPGHLSSCLLWHPRLSGWGHWKLGEALPWDSASPERVWEPG